MTTIEIARRMAALGEKEGAMRAYELVLHAESEPIEHWKRRFICWKTAETIGSPTPRLCSSTTRAIFRTGF